MASFHLFFQAFYLIFVLDFFYLFINNKEYLYVGLCSLSFPPALYELLLLLVGWLTAFISSRYVRTNPVLGYLTIGVLLGPCLLGILEKTPFMSILSELGVWIFLFTVGLEVPLNRLIALRRYIFGFGFTQVVFCTLAISILLRFQPFFPAPPGSVIFFIAAALAFSSTAVIIQLLSERFEMTTVVGRACLGILLFQDLAAIALFAGLGLWSNIADGQSLWMGLYKNLAGLVGMIIIMIVSSRVTEKIFSRYPQVDVAIPFTLLLILCSSLFTGICGLSTELGAFMVGVSLANTQWRHQISVRIHPIRAFLLAVFFIVSGLEIDVIACLSQKHLIFWGFIGLMITKTVIVGGLSLLWKFHWSARLQFMVLIAGTSEFLFIVLAHPLIRQHLPGNTVKALIGLNFLSMIATPLLFNGIRRMIKWLKSLPGVSKSTDPYDIKCEQYDVLIAGFGHIGQTVAKVLSNNFIPFLVVDYDILRVEKARQMGYMVLQGDARDIEFLKKMGLGHAKTFILTFGYLPSCVELVKALGAKIPHVYICVQVRSQDQAAKYAGLGVSLVVPEELQSGMRMACLSLESLGFSQGCAREMTLSSPQSIFMHAVQDSKSDDPPAEKSSS